MNRNTIVLLVLGIVFLLGVLAFANRDAINNESSGALNITPTGSASTIGEEMGTDTVATATPVDDQTATSGADAMGTEVVTVDLSEQNGSGMSGVAVLTPVDNGVRVDLQLMGNADTVMPAHIHMGRCPTPGDVVYPLTNVVDGRSITTVNATMDQLTAGDMAINVHRSADALEEYIACGNIE